MNRRAFFSSFGALLGAASLSPNIFIPKFEPVKWRFHKIPDTINQFWLEPIGGPIGDVRNFYNFYGTWIWGQMLQAGKYPNNAGNCVVT